MEKALTIKQGEIVNIEDQAMSISSLLGQIKLIQDVMSKIMVENEHYGTIPGTKKPTLYKPGAEKLCLTFRLNPDYDIIREIRDKDFISYTIKCNLTHIPTGQNIASGIGSCNSKEAKYRYRFIEESTGVPIPQKYWDAKKKGDNKEMKRLLQIPNLDTENLRAAKIDGEWIIAKSEKIENDNPWDLDNTLIKMACKRALVAAILNATAASDIFTQDIEDMPAEIINGEVVTESKKPPLKPPQKSPKVDKRGPPVEDQDKGKGKVSTPKENDIDASIIPELNKFLQANRSKYYEVIGQHGVNSIEDILHFEPDAQESLLKDLKKEIG